MFSYLNNVGLNFSQRNDLAAFLSSAGYLLTSEQVDELRKPEHEELARKLFMAYHRYKGCTEEQIGQQITGLNDGLTLLSANPFGTDYPRSVLNEKLTHATDALSVLGKVNHLIKSYQIQKE